MKDLKQFIGRYGVEKTLRFELEPVGKTEEWMNLANDKERADKYAFVKELIDRYHKVCIRESLAECDFDWRPLAECLETCRKSRNKDNLDALNNAQKELRSKIAQKFHLFKDFAQLTASTPDKLLKNILPNCVRSKSQPEFSDIESIDNAIKSMSMFDGFASYFEGYQNSRKNLYAANIISSSVAHRVVHENFPKFLSNIKVFENIRVVCPEVIERCAAELGQYLNGLQLDEVFSVDYYNKVLTQGGIDLYNTIIGGVSEKEGESKHQGINELVNLFLQSHEMGGSQKNALTMVPLFKQILSDKKSYSYITEEIKEENELISVIQGYHSHISSFYFNGKAINILEELQHLLDNLCSYNLEGIYVENKKLNTISNKLYGNWSELRFRLTDHLTSQGMKKATIEKFFKKETFSLAELNLSSRDILKLFADLKQCTKGINRFWKDFEERNKKSMPKKYKESNKGIEIVRMLLESYKKFISICSLLDVENEGDSDTNFYGIFTPLITEMQDIDTLYNKARNFLSQKPSDKSKYLLKFDNCICANGWDAPQTKSVLIFRRQGMFLLGVVDNNHRSCLNGISHHQPVSVDDQIEYLVYRQGGHMDQNLQTLMVRDGKTVMVKGKRDENGENQELERQLKELLPPDIYRIRKSQSYINNSDNFCKEDLTLFIDYYKQRAKEYYAQFEFEFKESCDYASFKEFAEEINSKAYRIAFLPTSYKSLASLVNAGELYLFTIKNKDYEPGAHGKKNLHTLYWEQLFNQENLHNLVIKLNAKSTLFCRPQVIKAPTSHKKGSMLLNRKDKDGMPIPEPIYQQLYKYVNGKIREDGLSDDAKAYLDKIIAKEAQYTIIKDKRYTKQKYFIHISTTLNANATNATGINEDVWDYLRDNPDVNIIGIDRGERNLLYLTLINQKGEILLQKSLNVINGFDYHAKLEQREKERDEARKSWQTVGNITDLKEGYLSAAIHEITTMMIENNAIIVLEDLNRKGFMPKRFKFEKQVYQLFEKKLIEKLNYLCSKDIAPTESGGVLRGYQLTEKFVSFEKMTKQNGFLFYVRPDYTSAIDPVTGFVSHFGFKDIRNTKSRKDFFEKMESIIFTNGHVEFVFDYSAFKPKEKDYQNRWTISSVGRRIVWDKQSKLYSDYYPTNIIVGAFADRGIALEEGTDIKALLAGIDDSAHNAEFYNILFEAFKRTVQLRNSNSETGEDYILSPALHDGKQYSSLEERKKWDEGAEMSQLPIDADANGAYHIALKGLYLIMNPQEKKVDNEKWFRFVVEKPFMDKF